MPTNQLLILLLVIVGALLLVWLLVRRSSAKKDLARAEAAEVRAEAEQVAASVAGLETYAAQSEERADLARAEAEQAAREADRLIVEADQHRTEAEVTRRDYEAMLARADEVDPDVRASDASTAQSAQPESSDAAPAGADADADVAADGSTPLTRAEARQQREEAERAAWAGSPAAPIPGAAGAAVMGADTWAAHEDEREHEAEREDEAASLGQQPVEEAGAGEVAEAEGPARDTWEEPTAADTAPEEQVSGWGAAEESGSQAPADDADAPADERSARIAAATDFRDDTGSDSHDTGTGTGTGSDAASEPLVADGATPDLDDDAVDPATDAQTPTNEWGGPHDETVEDEPAVADGGETAAPEARDDVASEATDDRYDPTPERDWAADEGTLLAENEERAERLAEDRADMEREAAAAGMDTPHEDEPEPESEPESEPEPSVEEPAAASVDADAAEQDAAVEVDSDADAAEQDAAVEVDSDADATEQDAPAAESPAAAEDRPARRVSEFHEIRDGGFGMGSAAPIDDGAQPLDHPVQAYRDTMTYRVPGDPGYDEAGADVWFYDAGAAERSGFRRSEG